MGKQSDGAIVVGAGLAGLTAAVSLARAGVRVQVFEAGRGIGGRWGTGGTLTKRAGDAEFELPVEYGLHGIWRRYVNLRALIESVQATDRLRQAVTQELVLERPDGDPGFIELGKIVRDSKRPHFGAGGAMFKQREWSRHPGMLRHGLTAFRKTLHVMGFDPKRDMATYDDITLDRLIRNWPSAMYRLFKAMSYSGFFAEPDKVSVAAFMTGLWHYGMTHREDCGFHVLDDLGATVVLGALVEEIEAHGGEVRLKTRVDELLFNEGRATGVRIGDTTFDSDAVILAVDGPGMAKLASDGPLAAALEGAAIPRGLPSASVRLFTEHGPAPERAATGMFGDGNADNFFWLQRVLTPYKRFHEASGQGVLEMHLYGDKATAAVHATEAETLAKVKESVRWAYPEAGAIVEAHLKMNPPTHTAFEPGVMSKLPPVAPGPQGLALCGDWIACPVPVMYLERACTTGLLAAQSVAPSLGLRTTDVTQLVAQPPIPFSTRIGRAASRLAGRFGLAERL